MWYHAANDHQAVLRMVLGMVCHALSQTGLKKDALQDLEADHFEEKKEEIELTIESSSSVKMLVDAEQDAQRDTRQDADLKADPYEELKKEIIPLVANLEEYCVGVDDDFDPKSATLGTLDVVGLGNLVNASVRLAVKDRNPKLVGLLLKTVLFLADDRQIEKQNKESRLLQCGTDAFGKQGQIQPVGRIEGPGGPGIQSVLNYVSFLLPNILPARSGFSQQTIDFLRSKSLFVSYVSEGFKLHHFDRLTDYFDQDLLMVTQDTTTVSADSVICAVTKSEKMLSSFDHVWLPLSAFRLIYLPLVVIWENSSEWTGAWLYRIPVILAALLSFVFALLGLTMYPLLLIYFYIVHGFKAYTESGGNQNAHNKQNATVPAPTGRTPGSDEKIAGQTESNSQAGVPETQNNEHRDRDSTELSVGTACGKGPCTMEGLWNICFKPIETFMDSLHGTQSVAGHVLSLPGVGSLKSLQMLCTAPIDVFEAPAVRAAVEGMWSRFVFGFWVRCAFYMVHLLLFSAFSTWCIAHDLSYSEVNSSQDSIVRASFNGGCVAAGICICLLIREVMQCVACVADEGLKDYIEFWNVLQTCSLSLELASFAMFVSGGDPVATRLVTTYAVFFLWINLLYFTKAIRQISFLLEILVTIVSDMIPFLFIMAVFVMADALALQVLVGKMLDPEDPESGEVVFTSFGTPLDLVLRMAEGRQDMGGSVLEMLGKVAYQSNDEGAVRSAISCTIYLCFYFLFFFITIIALNALIALMGSSYEKVMEKKISQRWHSIFFFLDTHRVTHHN